MNECLWQQGILQANFDFVFYDKEKPDKPMYRKGKMHAPIKMNE